MPITFPLKWQIYPRGMQVAVNKIHNIASILDLLQIIITAHKPQGINYTQENQTFIINTISFEQLLNVTLS